MARLLVQLLIVIAGLVAGQNLLCPNEVAPYHTNDRTMSESSSEHHTR
jgi:hypothetical protein